MAAEVICFTSMTFDDVDEQLTLPHYNSLQRFWAKHPPMAVLLAHYVGFKGEEPAKAGGDADEMDEESMMELARVFGMPVKQPKE